MAKSAFLTVLLASTALALPLAQARAQTASPPPGAKDGAAPPPSRTTGEEVVVYGQTRKATGGGLIKVEEVSKSVSTVSNAFIATQPSIQNAYQYVQLTPGALVSTTDPYGLSEQGSINVHGLGQDELGYVLEGMPLNDIGFYTAYPSQFIDSENIDEISLAQGSADLDSPVISAAGGLMNISMLDPSVRPGGVVDLSYGSYNANREFIRLDTGLIGNTGFRAFVSYSHTGANDWIGPGRNKRQHIDFKVVKEWNENRFTLSGTYHDGITPTYIEPTLSDFQQNGINNLRESTFTPGDPGYYKLYVGTWRLLYISAPTHLKLTKDLSFNITPYYQYDYGNSPYGSNLTTDGNYQGTDGPYTVSIPNYVATGGAVMANYEEQQGRAGVVAKFTYTTGPNSIIAGYWYDYGDERDVQSYTALGPTGVPINIWATNSNAIIRLPSGQPLWAGEDHVVTQINEAFIADTLRLLDDKLTIELGFKEAHVARAGTNNVPGPQYGASINNTEPLPRAAVRYKLDDRNQIFANVTTNFRTPSEATLFNAYYGGSIYGAANTNLKPEYSTSEDVGYRYTGPMILASATFFNYYFTNRQVATQVGGSLISESINVGSQTTRGVDIELGARPMYHISPYLSAEYLHSVQDNNFLVGTTYLPTAGKTAVRSPEFQGAIGLKYDDTTFFGDFNVKYVGSQYATFVNDEQIPSYTTVNLSLGVRLPPDGLKARPEIKVNIINLTDANYLATVANPTASVAYGSPTYYLSGGRAAMVTITQAF